MATLLEHLLERNELVLQRQAPSDGATPRNHCVAGPRPATATTALEDPAPDAGAIGRHNTEERQHNLSSASAPDVSPIPTLDENVATGGAAVPQVDTVSAVSDLETVQSSSPTERQPPRFPVVFVGFGTGANALLQLGTDTLLSPRTPDNGNGRDDTTEDGGSRTSDTHCASDAECTRLTAALVGRGLHVGGLVLVNGFTELGEGSLQASTAK